LEPLLKEEAYKEELLGSLKNMALRKSEAYRFSRISGS
jgi:hypothetical protein